MYTENLKTLETNKLLKIVLLGNISKNIDASPAIRRTVELLFEGNLNSEARCIELCNLFSKSYSAIPYNQCEFLIDYFDIDIELFVLKAIKRPVLWDMLHAKCFHNTLTTLFIRMIYDVSNESTLNNFFVKFFKSTIYTYSLHTQKINSLCIIDSLLLEHRKYIINWISKINLKANRLHHILEILHLLPREIFHTPDIKFLCKEFQLYLLTIDMYGVYLFIDREIISDTDIASVFNNIMMKVSDLVDLSSVHAFENMLNTRSMKSNQFQEIAKRTYPVYEAAKALKTYKTISNLDITLILQNAVLTKQEFNILMVDYATNYTNAANNGGKIVRMIDRYLYDMDTIMSSRHVSEYRTLIFLQLTLKKIKPLLMQGLKLNIFTLAEYCNKFQRNVLNNVKYAFKETKYKNEFKRTLLQSLNGIYFKVISKSLSHINTSSTTITFNSVNETTKVLNNFLKTVNKITDNTIEDNLIYRLNDIP